MGKKNYKPVWIVIKLPLHYVSMCKEKMEKKRAVQQLNDVHSDNTVFID